MGLDISAGHFGFRAGSYSGFHAWREILAEVSGNSLEYIWACARTQKRIAFQEILCHSDCDGHITYRECKKLDEDFDKYIFAAMEKINMSSDEDGFPSGIYWFERYLKWRQAVKMVVNKEANRIEFH